MLGLQKLMPHPDSEIQSHILRFFSTLHNCRAFFHAVLEILNAGSKSNSIMHNLPSQALQKLSKESNFSFQLSQSFSYKAQKPDHARLA